MLSDSPMPGVNTVNGMIGISALRLGATCSASPSRVWSNDRRASVPTVARAAWTAATACSTISLAPFVERVAGFVGSMLQPVVPLVYPLVGFVVAGVGDAQEG